MSQIPRPLARRIDALSRAAHAFHRFAHHPLCDEYAGEVVRIGRRGRVCRGSLCAWLGAPLGVAAAFVLPVSIWAGVAMLVVATTWVAVTTLLRIGPRRSKLATRFAPALAMGFALGEGVRPGGAHAGVLVALTLAMCGTLKFLYRRRGVDRTPCARCPERLGHVPCRGVAPLVRRERAFRRLATRMLVRAGI